MIKKVFRPFWSYDIQKTENWLSDMAEQGYHIVIINRGTRIFTFQEGTPQTKTYRIVYDKIQAEFLPDALLRDGWNKVFTSKNWHVMSNEKTEDQINTSTVREGIIKRNRMLLYIYGGIGIYLVGSALFHTLILIFALFVANAPVTFVASPLWVLTPFLFLFGIAVWVLVFYSIIKINKTNKKLINETGVLNAAPMISYDQELRSKTEEKQLKRRGQLVVRRKFGWIYAPDKLENWLEAKEEEGYNLYRVNKLGTKFYFLKGQARKVSYCADYQYSKNQSYIDIHQTAGWKNIYSSNMPFEKWTLWAREYESGEERPQLYSDKTHFLRHARRVAITYSCLFVPVIIMYLFLINSMIRNALQFGTDKLPIVNIILPGLLIIEFGWFTISIWLYYQRLRKKSVY